MHSFSELILYPWGDDDNQSTEPTQNFRNPAFDRRRGLLIQNGHPQARRYGEYLDPAYRRHMIIRTARAAAALVVDVDREGDGWSAATGAWVWSRPRTGSGGRKPRIAVAG